MPSDTTMFAGDWDTVLKVFQGKGSETGLSSNEVNRIMAYRDLPIRKFRLSVLYQVRPYNLRNRNPSNNHAVFYLVTRRGGLRFSMENESSTLPGREGPGTLQIKISTIEESSHQSLIDIESPFEGNKTVNEFVTLVDTFKMAHFRMHEDHEGCRHWCHEIVTYLINQGRVKLLAANTVLGWEDKTQLSSPDAKSKSLSRLGEWAEYEYNLDGKYGKKPMRKGHFFHTLPAAGNARTAALPNQACSFCHPPQAGNRR